MIKRILVILIFLISILCLTSVNASDLSDLESMDSNSIQIHEMNDLSHSINDVDDMDIDNANDVFIGNGEGSLDIDNDNDVFIGDDEGSLDIDNVNDVFIGNDDDTSLEDEKTLSTGKKTKLGYSTNLELDNDADKENLETGELVTWILEAKNKGPNNAKNVKVFNLLLNGLKVIAYSTTKGLFNVTLGIWDIGDLESGEEQVLKIITKALTPGKKVNKAKLTSDTKIAVPEECIEEEEIDVEKKTNFYDCHVKKAVKKYYSDKKVSSLMYPTGNPIAVLIVSILLLLTASFKRRY